MSVEFRGAGVVPGMAVGTIRRVETSLTAAVAAYVSGAQESENEKILAAQAVVGARLTEQMTACSAAGQSLQAAILTTQQLMVQDPMLTEKIQNKTAAGIPAPQAILTATEEEAAIFDAMDDAYLRERAADIRCVGQAIARQVLGISEIDLSGDEAMILTGVTIEPSLLASIPAGRLVGVLLGEGSRTSHAVILARARSLPTIVGVGNFLSQLRDGDEVLLDGEQGLVRLQPTAAEVAFAAAARRQQDLLREKDAALRDLPAVTPDGVRISLLANIGTSAEVVPALEKGAEGIGLFRSEVLFLGRASLPTEEEQYIVYRAAVENCRGKRCVFRTLDIGGDKPLAYLDLPVESNPFLGWRAIRISLDRPDLFQPQLRAILRAGAYGPVAVLLPMIVSAAEVRAARQQLEKARTDLLAEGIACADTVPLGLMIETPAAALTAKILAQQADFFSIGTNDLIQYTLAADRGNPKVSSLYSPFYPAVLQLILQTISAGREAGIPVGMCGEMAGDSYAAVLLLAMGISELSMTAASIPGVKAKLRQVTAKQAKKILGTVLAMDDAAAIEQYLRIILQ
jgi:phosphoenolpyruvate-protein phosphotransferase (PTS system enzyme I)